MFEFMTIANKGEAKKKLKDRWFVKFLRKILQEKSMLIDEKPLKNKLKIPDDCELGKGITKYIDDKRKLYDLPVGKGESFQYMLSIMNKLKSNRRQQYRVLMPLFLCLSNRDTTIFVGLLTKRILIPKVFIEVLKEEGE